MLVRACVFMVLMCCSGLQAQLQKTPRQHLPALPSVSPEPSSIQASDAALSVVNTLIFQSLSPHLEVDAHFSPDSQDDADIDDADIKFYIQPAPRKSLSLKENLKWRAIHSLRRWAQQANKRTVNRIADGVWLVGAGIFAVSALAIASPLVTANSPAAAIFMGLSLTGISTTIVSMSIPRAGRIERMLSTWHRKLSGTSPSKFRPTTLKLKYIQSIAYSLQSGPHKHVLDTFRINFFAHQAQPFNIEEVPDAENEITLFHYSIEGFEHLTELNDEHIGGKLSLQYKNNEYTLVHKTYQAGQKGFSSFLLAADTLLETPNCPQLLQNPEGIATLKQLY